MVTSEDIKTQINTEFDDVEVRINPDNRIYLIVDKSKLLELASFVKHELGFQHPNFCTGIDNKDKIDVLWHVGHLESPILIILQSSTDREESVIPSLTNLWKGFNWHERETYDLVGVNFDQHPDLRRIIMPENWEGHPLREDYIYKKPNYRKLEDMD
jgi:NADH-quinone oxidoreductase subunit C